MTERVNLVDAYDNRSVIAKMVNMEERISGAETSVEASADAAASSASAAAASQTAAKTSETNAKASADTAAATLANTVDLSSKQTVTGAKTFAGDTTVTGSFVTSANAEMAKLDIDTGKLTVGSGGSAEINGPLTASNTANVIKAANHDSVLTSNDVLTAKDINEVNGSANNLIHRSGDSEIISSQKIFTKSNTNAIICQVTGNADCISIKGDSYDITDGVPHWLPQINWKDKNGILLCGFQIKTYADGTSCFAVRVRNSDGSIKEQNLVVGDVKS